MEIYEKKGFVHITGLDNGRVDVHHSPCEQVAKMKSIVPWTKGCLISDGRDLFQLEFKKTKEKIQPIYLMALARKYKLGNELTRFV